MFIHIGKHLKPVKTKLTRNRNATNLFPRHFLHVVLNGFIFINRYAGLYTFHALSIFLQSLLYFRWIYRSCKKCTCVSCALTTWRFDTKKCVYMCLIDLLNDDLWDARDNKIKLTRKRNATKLFPRHFSHLVLNGFIFIYRYK